MSGASDGSASATDSPIIYIVFDANVFGEDAFPNIRLIEKYVEVCRRRGVELLIPESVVWELAEHATARSQEILALIETHNRKREQWGISIIELPGAFSPEDIRRNIEDAGATVIELTEADAKEALRDQVLQVGAGTRKGKTKTGASDSAAFRSVVTEYGNVIENVLIVTADTEGATSTFERLGGAPPRIAKHLRDIGTLFDETVEAGDEVSVQFFNAVERLVMGSGILDEAALVDIASDFQRAMSTLPGGAGLENRGWEVDGNGTNFVPFTIRPTDGAVIKDEWTKTVKSTVAVEGWLLQDLHRQDFIGSDSEYATYQVKVSIDLEIELGFDGGVTDTVWDLSYISSSYDPSLAEIVSH